MPAKKRTKKRGSQERERMSTRARSPEVDELSCIPETQQSQQAAGAEELVVGVLDSVEMLDTEQGDIGWGHSRIRIQVMRIYRIHRLLQGHSDKGKADKRSKKPPVLFTAEQEQKVVDFLRDNEILYSKRLMDYKDRSKRETVWDNFCEENNLNKDACQKVVSKPAHTLRKSHSHEVWPGGTSLDREAEMDQRQF